MSLWVSAVVDTVKLRFSELLVFVDKKNVEGPRQWSRKAPG